MFVVEAFALRLVVDPLELTDEGDFKAEIGLFNASFKFRKNFGNLATSKLAVDDELGIDALPCSFCSRLSFELLREMRGRESSLYESGSEISVFFCKPAGFPSNFAEIIIEIGLDLGVKVPVPDTKDSVEGRVLFEVLLALIPDNSAFVTYSCYTICK